MFLFRIFSLNESMRTAAALPDNQPKAVFVRLGAAAVFFMFTGLLLPDFAYAHRMLMQEEDPGVLFVYYEGRVPAADAAVTLMDEHGEVLKQGETDEDGRFIFDPRLGALVARADDGMGHRVVFDLEKSIVEEGALFIGDHLPLPLRIALGIGMIFLIYTALYFWTKRAKGGSHAHS